MNIRKLLKSLPYERLLQALYCLGLFATIIPNKSMMLRLGLVILGLALILSTASIVAKRALSYAVWPTFVLVAAFPAVIVLASGTPTGNSGFAAAMTIFMFGLASLLTLYFAVLCLVFAPKDFYKLALILVLSTSFTFCLDLAFITENEIGEKGSDYYLDKYPEWRVILSD